MFVNNVSGLNFNNFAKANFGQNTPPPKPSSGGTTGKPTSNPVNGATGSKP